MSFWLLQTGGQYLDEEQSYLGVPPLYLKQFNYSQYCYDATWTLAYALNQTINGNVYAVICVCVSEWERVCPCAVDVAFWFYFKSFCSGRQLFHLYFTAELEENSALNSKVWDAAGLRGNGTFPLDHFSYNNSALLNVIFQHVQRTNFSGITVSGGFMFTVV